MVRSPSRANEMAVAWWRAGGTEVVVSVVPVSP